MVSSHKKEARTQTESPEPTNNRNHGNKFDICPAGLQLRSKIAYLVEGMQIEPEQKDSAGTYKGCKWNECNSARFSNVRTTALFRK